MRAGTLNRQVTIRKSTATQNTYGEQERGWTDLMTIWARVNPLSGSERFAAQQIRADLDTEFTVRYTTAIRPDMLIAYGGLEYDIHALIDVGDRHRELRILAAARTT